MNPTAMLAGLYHDWRHPGGFGNPEIDKVNVERAALKVLSLPRSILPDEIHKVDAADMIRATVFPMSDEDIAALDIYGKALRDADVWHMAMLNVEELLALQISLACEAGRTPHEQFKQNMGFVQNLPAHCPYAQRVADKSRKSLFKTFEAWAKDTSL